MNPLLSKIIRRSVLQHRLHVPEGEEEFSSYEMAKGLWELKITILQSLRDICLILLGICSAAFGLKGFLLPSNFIDGGATGISLLISAIFHLPLYWLIIIINVPFVFLGYKVIGRSFAVKTALAITGLAVGVATLNFPEVTHDKLLVAIFGGFFLGAGIGLAVRGGGVIDGTEVLAIYLSKKFSTTIGDVIVFINIIIFSTAAYFLSIEAALYSLITYLSASKTLDFIIEGIEEYTSVTIISSHSGEIREMIINRMGRGVTIYNGKSGFGKSGETRNVDIIFTVVTRLELNKLKTELLKIDPNAFIVMSSVKDTKGGMIKKRPLKH